ncbi:MAG: 23S rRNA (pseudouridine(1915)-N(3))-methyltransferase RlmH [Gemmatimonadales bacterium]
MKIIVIAVGTPKMPGLRAAIREYESRIKHYYRFEAREIRPQRLTPDVDESSVIERESSELLAAVPANLQAVPVDRRGKAWTSEELAGYLEEQAVHGKAGLAFLIGGALGLSERLCSSASPVLSLSSFTLPHELARLVLVEQIYRAGTIRRGEPYHK